MFAEHLQKIKIGYEDLRDSEGAAELAAWDDRVGRTIGAVKAVLWVVCGAFGVGAGYAISAASQGWVSAAALIVAAAIGIYALWRAYRGVFHAGKASALVYGELKNRASKVEAVANAVNAAHARFMAGQR